MVKPAFEDEQCLYPSKKSAAQPAGATCHEEALCNSFMYYNVFFGDGESMPKTEQTSVVTVRLSKCNLNRVEAVQKLEKVDRSTLFKEFIEDGLRERVLRHYKKGKLTQRCAAELLGITLRES